MNKPPKVSKPSKKSPPSKPSPKSDEQRMVLASISKKEATAILLTKKSKLEKEIAAVQQKEVERCHKRTPTVIKELETEIAEIQQEIKSWKVFQKKPSIDTYPGLPGAVPIPDGSLISRLQKVNAQLASLKLIEGENILLTVVAVQALFDE